MKTPEIKNHADPCPICLAPLKSEEMAFLDKVEALPHKGGKDSHRFHRGCISHWIAHHKECPVCRRDFDFMAITPELAYLYYLPRLVERISPVEINNIALHAHENHYEISYSTFVTCLNNSSEVQSGDVDKVDRFKGHLESLFNGKSVITPSECLASAQRLVPTNLAILENLSSIIGSNRVPLVDPITQQPVVEADRLDLLTYLVELEPESFDRWMALSTQLGSDTSRVINVRLKSETTADVDTGVNAVKPFNRMQILEKAHAMNPKSGLPFFEAARYLNSDDTIEFKTTKGVKTFTRVDLFVRATSLEPGLRAHMQS